MADIELKKLSRAELLEIVVAQSKRIEELEEEVRAAQKSRINLQFPKQVSYGGRSRFLLSSVC